MKKEHIKKPNIVQSMLIMGLAELVGTALLLFLGCMGCIHTDIMPIPHHIPALSFGFTVMLIIQVSKSRTIKKHEINLLNKYKHL